MIGTFERLLLSATVALNFSTKKRPAGQSSRKFLSKNKRLSDVAAQTRVLSAHLSGKLRFIGNPEVRIGMTLFFIPRDALVVDKASTTGEAAHLASLSSVGSECRVERSEFELQNSLPLTEPYVPY